MIDHKLQKLFEAARHERAPVPAANFDSRVVRVIRREKRAPAATLFDQLGGLLPRLAAGAALVTGLCAAADFALSTAGPDIATGAAEVSGQWLFAANAF